MKEQVGTMKNQQRQPNATPGFHLCFLKTTVIAATICMTLTAASATASDIDGFTEPYRSVDVAAAEPGIIAELKVDEGQKVESGQILGQLDQRVLHASLRIAEQAMKSKGQLNSVQAELDLKSNRLRKLTILRQTDNASQEEVDRAAAEVAIANARVLTAQEALVIKKLEYARILVQIERTNIRSPIDGAITQLYREEGEFVVPTDPVVVKIVQLDPLLATFSIPSFQAETLATGELVDLTIVDAKGTAKGTVEFVSPVTDAQSGTVKVKIRLPNPGNKYRSGTKCTLHLTNRKPTKLTQRPKR